MNNNLPIKEKAAQTTLPLMGERIFVRGMKLCEWHEFWRGFVPDAIAHPEPYKYDERQCEKMFEHTVERAAWFPSFGIFLRETGEVLGLVQLKRVIPKKHQPNFPKDFKFGKGQCEFGIMLQNDSRKNLGYGSEAAVLIFPFAFERYDIDRIYADTFGTNLRMQHLLKKWGFRYLSIHKNGFSTPIGRIDKINYVLVQKWYNNKLKDIQPFAFLLSCYINLRSWLYIQLKEKPAHTNPQ